jgi:hypothetical protein
MLDPVGYRQFNPESLISNVQLDCLKRPASEDDDDHLGGKEEENEMIPKYTASKQSHGTSSQLSQSTTTTEMANGLNRGTVASEGIRKPTFTEDELLIVSPLVIGFSFPEECWLEFSLLGIQEIEWRKEDFRSLVLPHCIKEKVKDLVSHHQLHEAHTIKNSFSSKGMGLNIVLHGPPGVGKTLTCEAVAEQLERPLYVISAGKIGSIAESVEQYLHDTFVMAHKWGAIVLLDNADAFLQARQPDDIHRNSIVSVFLRYLEYHQVVLILTLNHMDNIDVGLQCRLQIGFRYETLSASTRRKIREYQVGKLGQHAGEDDQSEENPSLFAGTHYDELSKRELNGRQVCSMTAVLFYSSTFNYDSFP